MKKKNKTKTKNLKNEQINKTKQHPKHLKNVVHMADP